jgi:hypothetical protein
MANTLDQEVQDVLGELGTSASVLGGIDQVVVYMSHSEAKRFVELNHKVSRDSLFPGRAPSLAMSM